MHVYFIIIVKKHDNDHYDASLLITGVTGSGKSSLCGFLCCNRDAFKSQGGFASITSKSSAAAVTLRDKRIRLIDTPGFCDDYETEEEHMDEVGEALFLARKGVNAVGLAISAGTRYTKNNTAVINEISEISNNLWPFTFIVFTNADSLGSTEEERKETLKKNLSEERCPAPLLKLIKNLDHRYILIDSTNKTEEYHHLKVQELMDMVNSIYKKNNYKLYTNELFNKAKDIEEKILADKEKLKKKQKMAEFKAKFEEDAKRQQEIMAQEAKINEKLANQKRINMQKRMEGEEQTLQKQRDEALAQIEKDKQKLHEEKEKVQEEIKQLKLKASELQEDEQHELEEQADEEALEAYKQELRDLRRANEELKKKRSKKWFNVLAKKTTGKECTIQ